MQTDIVEISSLDPSPPLPDVLSFNYGKHLSKAINTINDVLESHLLQKLSQYRQKLESNVYCQ